jgi:2-oxoglutarate ferredoxin oxidoreductase subunit beta
MVVERAMHHKGVSFVEVYQNCNIFNDGAFEMFAAREVKEDRMIELVDGKPLIFGKNRDKGIRIRNMKLEVVNLKEGVDESELIIHDEKSPDSYLAYMLARMEYPQFPVPVGVFRSVEKATYEDLMADQIKAAVEKLGPGDLDKLINSGETWTID